MDQARQPHENNFKKDEKLFRSHIETSSKADWQSKYFIPRTYGLIMASLSEFAINKPDIIVEPDTRSDATRVPYMKAVMEANWRKNKGNGELLYAILDALKLGIAIIEVGYRKDKRKIKNIVKYDPKTEDIEYEDKEIFDFDDVYFETVNPRYFWVDEGCNTLSKANDCARLYIYSKQAFHDKFDSKFKEAKNVEVKGSVIKEEFFKPFIGKGIGKNEIGVYKYVNKSKDVMWWVANGKLLNEPDDPIPFHHKTIPYTEIKLAPYDKYTFYGMSLPRIVEDLQHEINTLRNMSIDQTHLNIFSPFFYSADEDMDESTFVVEPGVGIPASDPNSFNFFKQRGVGPDAYNMMSKFDEDIRQATGFDLRLQGLPAGGTATETAILKETSLKRINLYLRFLEELSFPDFAEIWGDTLQQFYFTSSKTKSKKKKKKSGEKEEIFRSIKIPKSDVKRFKMVETVGDYNFLEVKPENIRGDFGFNTKIGSSISISKELDKQVKLQLYSMMAGEPLVKRERLVVDVLKSHELDPEEYMTTTQEVDIAKSISLAEEHNKQLIAGEKPTIMEDLVTPEHIQIHDALIKSGKLDADTKKIAIKHVLEEMRVSKLKDIGGGQPSQQMDFPAQERVKQLTKPLIKQPGMTKETVLPPTAAETGAAVNRPIIKPK